MNPETKSFCWGCGKDLTICTCGSESIPIKVKTPTEILATCGSIAYDYQNLILEPWLDPDRKHEVLLRPCCKCGPILALYGRRLD